MFLWLTLAACTGDPDPTAEVCVTDEDFFAASVSPILQSDCIQCHVEGGAAGASRNLLLPSSEPGHDAANQDTLRPLALEDAEGTPLLLAKITGGAGHGGAKRFEVGSAEYLAFEELVARYQQPGGCEHPGPLPPSCVPGAIEPGPAPLRRLTDTQVANAVHDLLGVHVDMELFPVTEAGEHYSTWAEANVVSSAGVDSIMLAVEAVATDAIADLEDLLGCAPDEACARAWADDFAYRAYRRPLTSGEADILDLVFESDPAVDERVRRTIELVLQSPQFLYLEAESAGPVDDAGVDALTGFAIASRLSFFLLNTTPSDDLLAAAAAGQLSTHGQVLAIAREMVDDTRALPVVARFHSDWMRTYQLETIAKDESVYPEFSRELADEMRSELDLFTTEVVWMGDGTLDALLYSPVTWTTPGLDALYGTSDARAGDGWERRMLDATRPGVLSRTAFLTAHSYSATSSPVRRGAFVLEQMLCEDLTPPPGVDLNIAEPTETNTIRDRLASHRADPACAGCHDRIDPTGFAMEHYGALGEWRDDWENGIAVDATGSLENPTGDFDGLAELISVLDAEQHVRDCYAAQWFQYGMGRGLDPADACTLDQLAERFAFSGGDLRDLLAQIAASNATRYRHPPVLEDP